MSASQSRLPDVRSLAVPFHEFDLGYLNPVHDASGNDPMPVWLVHMMASALHTFLIPQVESELVLSVELVSALLL